MITFLFVLLFPDSISPLSNFPIVKTSYGAVRGYEYQAQSGFVGEIFKKISYAKAPTDARRWKKAEPPDAWNYTLDGTFFGPACAQVPSQWQGYVTGTSEDCLTLNSPILCPVVVYAHGGSVLFSGSLLFPDDTLVSNFAREGIVLVTIAYRLGVFGNMALGDENVVPINLALHDIVESLRFVRKEIAHFGGQKDQVTLMGHSAGASIAAALAFSPTVNKPDDILFAQAIVMSPAMDFWSSEHQVNISQMIASRLGCSGTALEIIDCLRSLKTNTIIQAAAELGGPDMLSPTHLSGLTLAGELLPFQNMKELRESQESHMKGMEKRTRMLIGTTFNEFRMFDEEVANVKIDLVTGALGVRNPEEVAQRYFDDVQKGKFDPGYDTESQAAYLTTSLLAQAHIAAGGEVYLYQFDYPKHSSHADDLYYVMTVPYYPLNADEQWLLRVYPKYFTNFIKGIPLAPDWTPLNPQLMNYYSVNKSFEGGTGPKMRFGYHQDLMDYYEGMIQFDDNLTKMKGMLLNAPVQYKNLTLPSNISFSFCDLIFYSTLLGLLLLMIVKAYEMCQRRRLSQNLRYV